MNADTSFTRPFMPFKPLDELPATRIDPATWPLPQVLPPGLTLMTGNPHCGKTSLAYQFALRAAQGQCAFTRMDDAQTSQKGHVLFLALDSSVDHLGQLTTRYLEAHPGAALPRNVSITNTCKALTPEEGLAELQAEFDRHPHVSLLVIDNLTALRTLFRGNDRKLFMLLRALAEQRCVSVLLLHTARASTPLATYIDHHLHLTRLTISSYYQLDVIGRQSAPRSYQLYCRPNAIDFRAVSTEEEFALATHGAQRAPTPECMALLSVFVLSDKDMLTPSQMAAALGIDEFCVRHVLDRMLRARLLVSPARQHYALSDSLKPLLDALFDQYPILPNFAVEELPTPTEAEMEALEEPSPKKAASMQASAESEPVADDSAAQRQPASHPSPHAYKRNSAQHRLAARTRRRGL